MKIPRAKDIYIAGLQRPDRMNVKRPIQEYGLGWTTERGGSFCPILVQEFYVNYQARLENICKLSEKVVDQPLLDRVWVRGIMVDVSIRTINKLLNGLDFIP